MEQQEAHGRGGSGVAVVTGQSAEAAGSVETFEVNFEVGQGRRLAGTGPARLQGKGRVIVRDTFVEFLGKSGRISWLSKSERFIVVPSRVFNVERSGKSLCIHLRDKTDIIQSIHVRAASVTEATRLAARLPKETTPEFAQAMAERSDFHARLDRLSPHAPAVPVMVAINVAVFIAMCVAGVGIFSPHGEAVIRWGSNFGPLTLGGQWWRLLTNVFVHFGIVHIALNMWALYVSGRIAERLFGSARFVLLYLFAGIAGSMASLLWNPAVNSAGASGAIFGVFGGLLAFVLNPRNAVPQSVMVEHRNSTLLFAGYSLFYGLAHSGVDNAAHIGGLLAGLAMGFLLARPLTNEARRSPGRSGPMLALGFGAVAILALGWPLLHPGAKTLRERQFGLVMSRFADEEAEALAAVRQLGEHVKVARPSRWALAAELSGNVTPKWNALYEEVVAVPLQAADDSYGLQRILLRYLDARRKQFDLLGKAVLADDEAVQALSEKERTKAEQALADLKALRGGGK
jgi:rhomboid protease GluP